jgi:hypothetical protein
MDEHSLFFQFAATGIYCSQPQFFFLQGILDWLREILSVLKTWTLLQKGSTDRERITPWGDAREQIGDDIFSQQW